MTTTVTRSLRPVALSVVICAYTAQRWEALRAGAFESLAQAVPGDEVIVVIDHNPGLLDRVRAELPGVIALANGGPNGLSGARNTGVGRATGDVVVFLDDDAHPEPGWLAAYRRTFARQQVVAAGGAVEPAWEGGSAPSWFPREFGWVVGCDYRGLPADGAAIRNPIGANMAVRRDMFDLVNGFDDAVGRVGALPTGCEETDLCIRIRQAKPELEIVRETGAAVRHLVPANRQNVRYFLSRCYHEGRSKAVLSSRVGTQDGLASERTYATRILPTGVLAGVASPFAGRPAGVLRAGMIVAGLAATATGFIRARRHTAVHAATQPEWQPLELVEFRVGELASEQTGAQLTDVSLSRRRLLAVDGGSPLGFVDLAGGEPMPSSAQVLDRLGSHVPPVEAPRETHTPMVSVVIPTRGRSEELLRCVRSVLDLDYPDFEVVVVDNNDEAGSVTATLAPVLTDARVRVLHEPERGVSPARNTGIIHARGEIIAATDDDVMVSRQWLRELVGPFSDPAIDCVTGLVVADGFHTPAQEMFEEFGGFSKGFASARYDLGEHKAAHALYPFSPGVFGSGNNMAYRRSAIESIGGYDRRLGPGTPVRSGEDLDVFLKMLFSGRTIFYQPRAWVRHRHRDSFEALSGQLRDYGRGLSAVMVKWAMSDRRRFLDILRRLPAGLKHYADPRSAKNEARSAGYPTSLKISELRGVLEGFVLMSGQTIFSRTPPVTPLVHEPESALRTGGVA